MSHPPPYSSYSTYEYPYEQSDYVDHAALMRQRRQRCPWESNMNVIHDHYQMTRPYHHHHSEFSCYPPEPYQHSRYSTPEHKYLPMLRNTRVHDSSSDRAEMDAAMTLLSIPQKYEQLPHLLFSPATQQNVMPPLLIQSRTVTPYHGHGNELNQPNTRISCDLRSKYRHQRDASYASVSMDSMKYPLSYQPSSNRCSNENVHSNDSAMLHSPPPLQSRCNLKSNGSALTSFTRSNSGHFISTPLGSQVDKSSIDAATSLHMLQTDSVISSSEIQLSNDKSSFCRDKDGFSLALPEDEDALSPLHCFIRKHCIEAFVIEGPSSTSLDATDSNRKVGRVGIRCIHCKNLSSKDRAERAICFPSTINNIYHSMETWQRRHALYCNEIPSHMKIELAKLIKTSRSSAGGRRKYWSDAAKKLGMVDSPSGIRLETTDPTSSILSAGHQDSVTRLSSHDAFSGISLCTQADRSLISPFLFDLMSQMEPCRFTEEDRCGGRSKVKSYEVGQLGLQCRHCHGRAGFGRYWPTSVEAMTLANSDRNIYNHMIKCRRCPDHIKNRLKQCYESMKDKNKDDLHSATKMKRGNRKTFFGRVWERLHVLDSEPS